MIIRPDISDCQSPISLRDAAVAKSATVRPVDRVELRGQTTMRTYLQLSCVTILVIGLAFSLNGCRRAASDDQTPDTSTYRPPAATPATQFERDMKFIRDGHFTHVWVFSRKDGKELTKEDSDALRTGAPKVVDWVTTDGNKKVIGGSNFPVDAPQMTALQKRFNVEDYSGK
jgi:hypothetical protein